MWRELLLEEPQQIGLRLAMQGKSRLIKEQHYGR